VVGRVGVAGDSTSKRDMDGTYGTYRTNETMPISPMCPMSPIRSSPLRGLSPHQITCRSPIHNAAQLPIVDDEPWARFEIERLLTPYSWLTIVGQAASASEAIGYLEREDLDAIFLDVQMQDGDGFSVLPSLPTPAPKIIFTTAYSSFAVRVRGKRSRLFVKADRAGSVS
jgi:CheY-like chemotaxis protein